MPKLSIALLFGGKSPEHEISIISAGTVARHIDRQKYELRPLYISRRGTWYGGNTAASVLDLDLPSLLKSRPMEETTRLLDDMATEKNGDLFRFDFREQGIDAAFPVLHGAYGEDGKVQGLLETFGVPYTGCGVQASALAMDKVVTKICAENAGVHVADYLHVSSRDYLQNPEPFTEAVRERFEVPFFVKPANLGSSVGIAKVHAFDIFPAAMEAACRLDSKVLVERAINGREVEVAVLGNDDPFATVPGEIEPGREFYDYTDKYVDQRARHFIPARIEKPLQEAVTQEAVTVYRALGCSGLSRIDFFIESGTGRIVMNEVNTIPGFTSISMYPMLMEHAGIGFSEIIDQLIRLALEKTSS